MDDALPSSASTSLLAEEQELKPVAKSSATQAQAQFQSTSLPATPNDDTKVLRACVLDAIQALPKDEASALRTALAQARGLVLMESDPAEFLRCEAGDALAAAKRLASYWNHRLRLFGERSMLPMTLSDGALSEDDIDALKTGYLTFLPKDKLDRTVVYFDNERSSSVPLEKRPTRFRCHFYMMHVALQAGKPFLLIRYSRSPHFDKSRADMFNSMVRCFPVKMEGFLCLYKAPPGAQRAFKQTVVPLLTRALERFFPVKNCIADSHEELLQFLITQGFEKEGLPPSAGGTWSYDDFTEWLAWRRDCDVAKPPSTVAQPPAPALLEREVVVDVSRARKRKNDIMYSRNRRRKEKKLETELQSKFSALKKANLLLLDEKKRLSNLLDDALKCVAVSTQPTSTPPTQHPLSWGPQLGSTNDPAEPFEAGVLQDSGRDIALAATQNQAMTKSRESVLAASSHLLQHLIERHRTAQVAEHVASQESLVRLWLEKAEELRVLEAAAEHQGAQGQRLSSFSPAAPTQPKVTNLIHLPQRNTSEGQAVAQRPQELGHEQAIHALLQQLHNTSSARPQLLQPQLTLPQQPVRSIIQPSQPTSQREVTANQASMNSTSFLQLLSDLVRQPQR